MVRLSRSGQNGLNAHSLHFAPLRRAPETANLPNPLRLDRSLMIEVAREVG